MSLNRDIADVLPDIVDYMPGVHRSIVSFGAAADATAAENRPAFDAADASGAPVYVPAGDWESTALPTGFYFGEGTITAEGDTLTLAATATRVNTVLAGDETTRLLSYALGPNAGAGMTDTARGNTIFGFNAACAGLTNGRNSVFGSDALAEGTSVTYMDVLGSRAGKYALWGNRCSFLSSNAGAWAGDPEPKEHEHDFWTDGSNTGRDTVWPPTLGVPGTGWRSLIEDGSGEPLAACLPEDHEDNEGNLATGRDAYDHGVKGRGNAVYGHHAAEGWNIFYCSAFGTDALEYGLTNEYACAFGAFSLKHKMRGEFDTATGAYALHYLVHGYENTVNGYKAMWNLTGGSTVPATADANANRNAAFGAYAGAAWVSGYRNTILGAVAALDITSGNDNVAVGAATFDQMVTSTRGTAVGYRAGYQNTTGLSNWVAVGALAGGLTVSNTGKIGASLTHMTISGLLASSRASVAISNAAGVTLTTAQIFAASIVRSGGGAVSDTTPTAAAIVAAIPGCEVGSSFDFWIANDNTGTLTIVAGSGVTLSRTTTVSSGFTRHYRVYVTNATAASEAVTVEGVLVTPAVGGTFPSLTVSAATNVVPLTADRVNSGYNQVWKRATSDKGGIHITTTATTLTGMGGNKVGLGYAADSSSSAQQWGLNTSTFAFAPTVDATYDLGESSLRVENTYSRQFRPGAGTPIWTSGSGTPEGAVTAPVGSLFTRTDGGAATTLYVKESGAGNTGWVAK